MSGKPISFFKQAKLDTSQEVQKKGSFLLHIVWIGTSQYLLHIKAHISLFISQITNLFLLNYQYHNSLHHLKHIWKPLSICLQPKSDREFSHGMINCHHHPRKDEGTIWTYRFHTLWRQYLHQQEMETCIKSRKTTHFSDCKDSMTKLCNKNVKKMWTMNRGFMNFPICISVQLKL